MKLSAIRNHLKNLKTITFQLPNGQLVPNHFHVTEVGKITKNFIDCGGKVRSEEVINFQLWEADDYDHRLHPEKLLKIIELANNIFKFSDLEIEVEYQGKETISKYNLDFNGKNFLLTTKLTACLALDACRVSEKKGKVTKTESTGCTPNSGCC